MDKLPKVFIIGAGFGGLFAAKALANKPVEVILIDKNNYHTFTPLLYQVATCALDPSEIAHPVRTTFVKNHNIKFLLGELTGIDHSQKEITLQTEKRTRKLNYDFLILACGSQTNFFGNQEIQKNSFDLKSLSDAVDLRNHVLRLFERAAWVDDYTQREAMLTFVVVGGGPTGIETAGALFELYNHVLDREFPIEDLHARVVLVEKQLSLLNSYPDELRASAKKQLESLGVEVKLGSAVVKKDHDEVVLEDGTVIRSHTMVWSVGVKGSPIVQMLGVPLGPGNRVKVFPTMQVEGLKDIYCIGDMCYLEDKKGEPYPQLSPVAQQQARLAAKNVLAELSGSELGLFEYRDRGSMATIGRSRAVAWLYNKIPISGFLAWVAWLSLHLVTLIGFRNRLNVLVNWFWNYLTYDRSVRIILEKSNLSE